MRFYVALALLGGLTAWSVSLPLAPGHRAKKLRTLVYRDVKPIFDANCIVCHHGPKAAHGLTLTSFATIRKGDRTGAVLVPGSTKRSRLASVLHGKPEEMPPAGPLPASQIRKIESWIASGAK